MAKDNSDKAQMFAWAWGMFGDKNLRPVPEYEFDRALGRKHRFDWAFPDYRVAVEVDGGQWSKFGGRHNTDADRDKRNLAASLRWLVFYFSPDQIKRTPDKCAAIVWQAIKDSQ